MNKEDFNRWLYGLWIDNRPRGICTKRLHEQTNLNKDSYVIFTEENFIKLMYEARLIGAIQHKFGLIEANVPASLSAHIGAINTIIKGKDFDNDIS